jgi:PAS domain S-box-containing protein
MTPSVSNASEALFAAILSIAADAIIVVDDEQRIVRFNEGAERVFGYAAEEVVGQTLDLLLPERYRTTHQRHVRGFGAGRETARQMGHRREIFGRRRDGCEFPAEASIAQLRLPDGRHLYSAVLRDITERKRTEAGQDFVVSSSAALARSLDFDTIVETIPRLVAPAIAEWCALDLADEGDLLRHASAADPASPALAAALDARYPLDPDSPWPVQDVLRSGRVDLIDADDEWIEAHTLDLAERDALRASGLCSMIMLPLVARDQVLGVLTLARSERTRRFDSFDLTVAGEFAARAAIAIDNARLYGAAQRATRARDEVLGVVSHDLRNPLSAISMCAAVLRTGQAAGGATRELGETIAESAGWMQRLIRDLLDIAALEAGRLSMEKRMEDARNLVDRVLELFEGSAAEAGVALRAEMPGDEVIVGLDAERILQVLANLVSNAIKFTESGGSVTVTLTVDETEIRFAVTDTGAGIPPEHIAHLFQLYWHARRAGRSKGSGYGLAIAHGIVVAHGGRIWVESTPGRGSTFRFTIPR